MCGLLSLNKTKGRKLIFHRTKCSRWADERDQFSDNVCENVEEVIGFFVPSRVTKERYVKANIASELEVNYRVNTVIRAPSPL